MRCRLLLMPPLACALAAQAPLPTWSGDIAAIVHRSCTPCHRPGQPAPFSLITYRDVQKRAQFVLDVVKDRYMPPWKPTAGEFVGDRRLSDDDIALLARWVEAGAPRGDRDREPRPPTFVDDWQLGPPDLVVVMPDVLEVPADGPDIVRNFVVPIGAERLRYVAAVEIRPNNPAVHHAVLMVDPTRQSRMLDQKDAEPGFGGMTLGAAVPPDGHFMGWTPGKSVRRSPSGMAWRLRPGDDFVLQLHAVPVGKPERVQPEIGLWFTDEPTKRVFDTVMLFSEEIDIPPGATDYTVEDHFVLPVPVTLHAIYPHAHYVCRTMRSVAILPNGDERVLFAIDDWDFDWQDDYHYRTPVELPAGTRITMAYGYDNSDANRNNPVFPRRRVRFGQQSADEMATLTLSMTLHDERDRPALQLASVERDLEKLPDAWNLLMRKAELERMRGNLAVAGRAIERACKISPGAPDVWFERALLGEARRDLAAAERDYRRALAVDPDFAAAHLQLGALYGRRGDSRRALEHFARAVQLLPNAPAAHNNYATACFAEDRLDDAERHYRRTIELDPTHFSAHFNLGRLLVYAGRRDEGRKVLQAAAKLRPDFAPLQQILRDLGK